MPCTNMSEYVFPAHLLISILFTYWQEKDSEKDLQNRVCAIVFFSQARVLVPKQLSGGISFRAGGLHILKYQAHVSFSK